METPQEYKARILSLMQGKDPIAVQRETLRQVPALVAGVSVEKLRRRLNPEKWSVSEILAHLAEAEVGSTWRYRQMIEHDGIRLESFDQNLWESLDSYSNRDPKESLELFRLLRQANLRMFENLTTEQWQKHGMHVERGHMTVRDLAVQIAGHDINHLEQIRKQIG